jgi:streptogramin lyase
MLALLALPLACSQPRAGGETAVDAAPEVPGPAMPDAISSGTNAERPPPSNDAPGPSDAGVPARDAPIVPAADGPVVEAGGADARKASNGESCTRHEDCLGGYCEGTCMAPFLAYPVPSTITDKDKITTGWDQGIWFTVGPTRRIGRMTRTGTAREFSIPPDPNDDYPGDVDDIVNGPDSAVWFCLSGGKVGRVELDGTMALFETGSMNYSADSTRLIVGPDRNIWYLTGLGLYVLSSNPETRGKILRTSPMGGEELALGADGRVWVFGGSVDAVVINGDGGVAAMYDLPSAINTAVVVGPDNQFWYAAGGSFYRVSQQGLASTLQLPRGSAVMGIIVGPDAQLWYTEPQLNRISRLNTGGEVTHLQLSTGNFPTRMTIGPDGALWYIDHGTGTINRLRR